MRKLGAGGMANVYLAEDQELGRRVAIKILNDRHAGDEQFVERFRREAKNAASLSHPNIVSIYDRGEAEGTYYIAMEYLAGKSLKELILERGPAPVSVAIDYARQILAALRFAHRNGIVHRDIKPHNVLVDSEGHAKVTDFGIARAGASQMTEEGSIIGTAQYLSPEQARGTSVDQTSDLYSLGIVLYEMLTGAVPFTGDSPVEIAMKHLSATPPSVSAKRPDVPKALDQVVLRALAKEPAARYQSAEEMDADLERISRGLNVSRETEEAATMVCVARLSATARRPRSCPRRRRRRCAAAAAHGRLLRLRAAGTRPFLLAVAPGDPARRRRGDRRLLRLQPDPGSAGRDEAGRRAVPRRNQGGERRRHHPRSRPRDRSRPHQPAAERLAAEGLRLRPEPEPGRPRREGQLRRAAGVHGQGAGRVPSVIGQSSEDAVAAMTRRKLEADVHNITSSKPQGTVIAQDPKGGVTVDENTKVRINVSSGPKPIGIPDVRGSSFETAASQLQALGFAVAKQDADSDQPAGNVIDQSPARTRSRARDRPSR